MYAGALNEVENLELRSNNQVSEIGAIQAITTPHGVSGSGRHFAGGASRARAHIPSGQHFLSLLMQQLRLKDLEA
jgi:hypothetical protein